MISSTGYIYAIVNSVSGRKYIGSAANLRKRWSEHRFHLRHGSHRNKHLQSAWKKYGEESFSFVELEQVNEDGMLIPREQHHLDANRPLVYNIGICAISAAKGRKRPIELVRALSDINRGNKYCLGRKHSEEIKALLSAQRKGTTLTPYQLKRISEGWAEKRAASTHCSNGHVWKESTTKWQKKPDGSHLRRICLICFQAAQAKSKQKEKAKRAALPKRIAVISETQRDRMRRLWKERVPPWKGQPLSEAHRSKLKAAWKIRRQRAIATYIRTPEIVERQRQAAVSRKARRQEVA